MSKLTKRDIIRFKKECKIIDKKIDRRLREVTKEWAYTMLPQDVYSSLKS